MSLSEKGYKELATSQSAYDSSLSTRGHSHHTLPVWHHLPLWICSLATTACSRQWRRGRPQWLPASLGQPAQPSELWISPGTELWRRYSTTMPTRYVHNQSKVIILPIIHEYPNKHMQTCLPPKYIGIYFKEYYWREVNCQLDQFRQSSKAVQLLYKVNWKSGEQPMVCCMKIKLITRTVKTILRAKEYSRCFYNSNCCRC